MRALVIDPFTHGVEERDIHSAREIQSCRFAVLNHFPGRNLTFTCVNELPRSEFHFQLGTEHVFSGTGVVTCSDSAFGFNMKSTDLSVAEIRAVATFFTAPRPPMGWLR